MIELPTLYKRTQLGQTQQWQMCIDGPTYYSIEGIQGGTLTRNKPTTCAGKNKGRANETTGEEQALKEAKAKWTKKVDRGYHESVTSIDSDSSYFMPMLAKKYDDYKDSIVFPVLVSRKMDGARLIASATGLTTRYGKPYNNCKHIERMLQPFYAKHPDWIIDSEIYSHTIPFERIMHIVRKINPTEEDTEESEKFVRLHIFDGIASDRNQGFLDRFNLIKSELNKLVPDLPYIVFVEQYEAGSHGKIKELHDKFVSEGYEGAMIRGPNDKYHNTRCKQLLKLKSFDDGEFEITDVIEGNGVRSGMAGSLVLKTAEGISFSSGIRGDEYRYRSILKNKNSIIGKQATIRYQGLTQYGVPRFPVCVDIGRADI